MLFSYHLRPSQAQQTEWDMLLLAAIISTEEGIQYQQFLRVSWLFKLVKCSVFFAAML